MQILRPEDLFRPLSSSLSTEIVTGALLLQNDDGGLSSSTPFIILHRWSLPNQIRPRLSCSFFMADSFTPTVIPAIRYAKEAAHARITSSLAGIVVHAEIPSPSQNDKNLCNRLASFFCESMFTAAPCVSLILSM
jgi:hypothetical protein